MTQSPILCYDCKHGEFDRYNPSKYGLCTELGVVRVKTTCNKYEKIGTEK